MCHVAVHLLINSRTFLVSQSLKKLGWATVTDSSPTQDFQSCSPFYYNLYLVPPNRLSDIQSFFRYTLLGSTLSITALSEIIIESKVQLKSNNSRSWQSKSLKSWCFMAIVFLRCVKSVGFIPSLVHKRSRQSHIQIFNVLLQALFSSTFPLAHWERLGGSRSERQINGFFLYILKALFDNNEEVNRRIVVQTMRVR